MVEWEWELSGNFSTMALDTVHKRPQQTGALVKKVGGFLGGTIVTYAVWYLVEAMGGSFFTAFIISTIASGFGIYYGVKIAKRYE